MMVLSVDQESWKTAVYSVRTENGRYACVWLNKNKLRFICSEHKASKMCNHKLFAYKMLKAHGRDILGEQKKSARVVKEIWDPDEGIIDEGVIAKVISRMPIPVPDIIRTSADREAQPLLTDEENKSRTDLQQLYWNRKPQRSIPNELRFCFDLMLS